MNKREKVRMMLTEYHLPHAWLIAELEKNGFPVWGSQISEILSGKRKGAKSEQVVDKAYEILERYGERYAGR